MPGMHEFREWLSSAEAVSEAYSHNLVRLTQVRLQDLLGVRKEIGDPGWTIWDAGQVETSSQAA